MKKAINSETPVFPEDIMILILKGNLNVYARIGRISSKPHLSSKNIFSTLPITTLLLLSDLPVLMMVTFYLLSCATIVWNPATRELRRVSMAPDNYNDRIFTHFGFGFSPIINDYMIVRFLLKDGVICKVTLFSLSIGDWRDIKFDKIKGVCIGYRDFVNFDVVSANGVVFFCGSESTVHGAKSVIVSFDLATEVFTVIQWPAFASCLSGKLTVYGDTCNHF